jgi:hypothetical protein
MVDIVNVKTFVFLKLPRIFILRMESLSVRIISNLFIKKFDYIAFSIGIVTLLLIIMNFFIITGFSNSNLYNQFIVVSLYYFATRGSGCRLKSRHAVTAT